MGVPGPIWAHGHGMGLGPSRRHNTRADWTAPPGRALCLGPWAHMGLGKISQARSPRQGVLGKVSYSSIGKKYVAVAKNIEQPGDDDGDDGRIFPEHPSPILHAPRDNISRKDNPSLRLNSSDLYNEIVLTFAMKNEPKLGFRVMSTRNNLTT